MIWRRATAPLIVINGGLVSPWPQQLTTHSVSRRCCRGASPTTPAAAAAYKAFIDDDDDDDKQLL